MKLHNSMVGDINGRIQTILVESVKLGYVINDLEVGEYHISKTFRHLLKFSYPYDMLCYVESMC